MRQVVKEAIIIFSVAIGVFLIVFLSLWFGGYVANMIWNYYAQKTTCQVIGQNVQSDTCSYSCNCYTSCTRKRSTHSNISHFCEPLNSTSSLHNISFMSEQCEISYACRKLEFDSYKESNRTKLGACKRTNHIKQKRGSSPPSQTCTTICQTCYYTCYDGYITVQFLDEYSNITYQGQKEVVSGYSYSSNVVSYLNSYFPMYATYTCFFNTRNPSDWKFTEDNPRGYYIAAITVAAACAVLIIGWLIVRAIMFIVHKWPRISVALATARARVAPMFGC